MGRDDAELLAQLRSGEKRALTVLYEQYRRPVYARAYLEVGSRPDAEELLQDTFLLLWKKRKRIEVVGGSLLPWLLVTARYLALNRSRRNRRREADPLPEAGIPVMDNDPLRHVMWSQYIEVVQTSLSKLDRLDRLIVELCLVEGLTYKEAAARLSTSHAVVRNRLARARASVRADAAAYVREEER